MRKALGTVLLFAGVTGLLIVPSGVGFHGAPYEAWGTAALPGTAHDENAHRAELWWSGQSYTIRLYDTVTLPGGEPQEILIHTNSFPGSEDFTNIVFESNSEPWCPGTLEIADYEGRGSAGVLPIHSDHVPVVSGDFHVTGWQKNCLGNGQARMYYTGNYLFWSVEFCVGELDLCQMFPE